MLVLGRKENESIIIGDNIRVTIVGRSGSCIRLGIQAPRHIRVVREELTRRTREDAPADNSDGPQAVDAPERPAPEAESDEVPPASAGSKIVIGSIDALTMPPQAAG